MENKSNEKVKEFKDYFKESMISSGIPASLVPESLFSGAVGIKGSLLAMAEASKMLYARATVAQLFQAVTASGGLGQGGGALLTVGVMKAATGVASAYYLGCMAGAFLYAWQMTTIGDSWMNGFAEADVKQIMTRLKQYGVDLPSGTEAKLIASQASQKASGQAA